MAKAGEGSGQEEDDEEIPAINVSGESSETIQTKNLHSFNQNTISPSSFSDLRCESSCCEEKSVRKYARRDLEALRFADLDLQKEKWHQVYQGLDSRVTQEYDELTETVKKGASGNLDRRRLWERKEFPIATSERVECALDSEDQSGVVLGLSLNEESFVAEEEFDEFDSDDEFDSIQRPAFSVEGEPDYESGPPQDGWEYLRRVRWEAAQMPRVRVCKVDRSKWSDEQTPYMPKIPEIAKCPENLRPSKLWLDQFLTDFSDLRKAFSEWEISPNRINIAATSTEAEINSEDAEDLRSKNTAPTLSAILKMDPVTRAANLRNRIKAFELASSLSSNDCSWIFSLCASVDVPMDAEMGSCLRRLLRKCSSLLAKKTDPSEEEVARLNILVAISGRFFGQSEEI
ncbi:uncharacterized protein LOC144711388 [Wolffia australiana]